MDGSAVILQSKGARNHWLGITLLGAKSNRSAIGTRVIATDLAGRKRVFDVTTAGSYLSSGDGRVVIGLGPATSVRSIEIRWPSGRVQIVESPLVDRYHTITEKQES